MLLGLVEQGDGLSQRLENRGSVPYWQQRDGGRRKKGLLAGGKRARESSNLGRKHMAQATCQINQS